VSDTEDSEVSADSEQDGSALSDAPATESSDVDSEAEKTPPPVKKAPKARAKPTKKGPIKKVVPENKPIAKKTSRKVMITDEEDNEDHEAEAASSPRSAKKAVANKPSPKKGSRGSRKVADSGESSSDDENVASAPIQKSLKEAQHDAEKNPTTDNADKGADSGSEMSVLIDEAPPPKKKRQKKDPSDKPAKASKPKKAKEAPELSADDAEIKRLQGWLVKCGIRKLWGKELKPYDTPKEKIRHLKGMLSEVGMDGRYSVEKARSIKERRELAADLEAVQEFGKRWGDEEDEGRKKGSLRRGAQKTSTAVAHLSSDDSGESDEDDAKTKIDRRVADWGIDADLLGSDGGEETD
jgi:hypothetical protein